MAKIAVTFSPAVGGSMALSLRKTFADIGSEVIDADFREMMSVLNESTLTELYRSREGRLQLFAHAKIQAEAILKDIDSLALSGNTSMVDPSLFNKLPVQGESYDVSRTLAELALVHVATQKGMPILGICGGHQVLDVYGGGEIRQLTPQQLELHRFRYYKKIKFHNESLIAQILSKDQQNSDVKKSFFGAHTQVVSKLGKGFTQTGTDTD